MKEDEHPGERDNRPMRTWDERADHPVYMDPRAFGWLVEGEGIETVGDLIGRPVYFNGESIEFLNCLEAA